MACGDPPSLPTPDVSMLAEPAEPRAGFKPQGDAEVDLGGPEAAHTPSPPPPRLPGDTAKREGSMASSFCSPQNREAKAIPGALANTLFPPDEHRAVAHFASVSQAIAPILSFSFPRKAKEKNILKEEEKQTFSNLQLQLSRVLLES